MSTARTKKVVVSLPKSKTTSPRGKGAAEAKRQGKVKAELEVEAEAKPKTLLYMHVQRTLIGRIEEKKYPIGSRLPTEGALSKEFHVSRHTVREALRHLRDADYISSRQGSGYTVEGVGAQQRYVHSATSLDDLLQYVTKARLDLKEIRMIEADAALASKLNCSPGRKWLYMWGIRSVPSSPAPIGYVEVFIHSNYAGIRKHIEDHKGAVYSLIESNYGERIEEVVQTMRAAVIPARFAAELDVKPDAAALEIERVFRSASNKVIEVSFNYHPVNRFSYTMLLRSEAER